MEEEGDRLCRLAEAHVVRKTRPESPLREESEPARAAQLVVAQRAVETSGSLQYAKTLFAAQFIEKTAQPAVRTHAVHAESPGATKPEGERDGVVDGHLLPLHVAQRTQGLTQHGAVDLDPAVAEKHERRVLVEEELDFLFGDDLSVHADRELRRDGRGRLVGDGCDVGLGGHVFAEQSRRRFHRVAGAGECLRARAEERFRRRTVEFGFGAAERGKRRKEGCGLSEGDKTRARAGHGREAQPPYAVLFGGRFKGEAQCGAVGGGDAQRHAPHGEVVHERADVVLVRPCDAPIVAAEREEPGVMDGIWTRRTRFKRGTSAEARKAVHEPREERAARRIERQPPRGESAHLLHEMRQVGAVSDSARGGAERLRRRKHVISKKHARLETARPHIGKEHQEIAHGRDDALPFQPDLILEPDHLAHRLQQLIPDKRHEIAIHPHGPLPAKRSR